MDAGSILSGIFSTATAIGTGGLGGVIAGAIPKLFGLWQDRQDKKHELELLKLQIERDKEGHVERMEEIGANAQIETDKSRSQELIEWMKTIAAQSAPTGNPRIDALNASVRPAYAFAFLGIYFLAKIATVCLILALDHDYVAAIAAVWTYNDQVAFGVIMGYFFIQRGLQKEFRG